MTTLSALTAALLALTALVVALSATIAARRALRRHRDLRSRRLTAPLRPLLLELAAGEPEEQLAAWRDLTRLDPAAWRAVESAVVALLGKVRGESRTVVVHLLAERGVIARAERDLHRRGAVRRARAAELLGAAGQTPAVPALVRLLGDRDAEVRLVAARALGRVGAPTAAAPLLAALAAPHAQVPVPVVAQALLRIGLPAAPAVAEGLASGEPIVRTTAAEVLGRLGAVTSAEPLHGLLLHDPRPDVRAVAAAALGRLGLPGALEALAGACSPYAPAAVRLAAVRAMGELGAPAAAEPLAALRGDDDERVAAEAERALVALGAPALAGGLAAS